MINVMHGILSPVKVTGLIIWWTLVVSAQFPAYFFSTQQNLSPPNCVCQAQINSPQNPGLGFNNPYFPVNPSFPTNQNFPANPGFQNPSNLQFPNINNPSIAINSNPNFPVDRYENQRLFNRQQYAPNLFPASFRICGTDGQTYSDVCQIINSQYINLNLGGRPCDLTSAVQQALQKPNDPSSHGAVCMNSGQTVASANQALPIMLNNPNIGIRCQGTCPCLPLSCPPTINSNNGQRHHSDFFNHWSFHHHHGHHGRG